MGLTERAVEAAALIYFGVFAHDDLKGTAYFDPEPPLSKEFIAAGEWLYGWWRVTFEGYSGSYADAGFTPFGWAVTTLAGAAFVSLQTLALVPLVLNAVTPEERGSSDRKESNPL